MTKVYIRAKDETVHLEEELRGDGLGKYWGLEIKSTEDTNDFGMGKLFTWLEPDLDTAIIYNENQTVMLGQSFDLDGNLYDIVWTRREGVDIEKLNGLDEFADWESPHSIVKVEVMD